MEQNIHWGWKVPFFRRQANRAELKIGGKSGTVTLLLGMPGLAKDQVRVAHEIVGTSNLAVGN
jgi:hypothetical protein